ncbi:MAG: hypothetical protein K6E28_03300 [Eubacterium sp.]|nr:hypothetical protein [Eubacterium sp.]
MNIINDSGFDTEYIKSGQPDREKIKSFLLEAKGEGRTMADFAKVCGVSPATFSRLSNGKNIRPLSKDLVKAIIQNADARSRVSYSEFMQANGMTPRETSAGTIRVNTDPEFFDRLNDFTREYIPAYVIDKTKLSMYLRRAKGDDRTMAEFADACRKSMRDGTVSPSTFSRISNGNIEKPLSDEMLQAIVVNSADPAIDYQMLQYANGKIPADDDKRVRMANPREGFEKENFDQRQREREMRNVIADELTARGKVFQVFPRLPQGAVERGRTGLRVIYGNYAISVQGYEPPFWNIIINATGIENYDGAKKEYAIADFKRRLMDSFALVFLRDAWEPETFCRVKNSIAVSDPEAFEALEKMIEEVKVQSWISIILVDTAEQKVVREKHFNRKDGKTFSSIFDEPKSDFE